MAGHQEIDVDDVRARIAKLEALLTQQSADDASRADIWFLLDRSGSMSAIAGYVVQGFDEFIADQRKDRGHASLTLVQFDDQDVHDVVVDAEPLDRSCRSPGCSPRAVWHRCWTRSDCCSTGPRRTCCDRAAIRPISWW